MDRTGLDSLQTQLDAVAEIVERQRSRIASLTEPLLGTEHEHIVAALHEAERQLLVAVRGVQRAAKAVDRTR